ncbi:hypothetical protein MES4922_420016 [Mesorhizobium ventifaucium]|uniref:Uncharacterized protein n=1 Tax=Mesorhizobium ventifaucium TaxID=666020 RepID=A0ABM9E9U5_9HYPH|nr:hypothetical protein MES4922_420016 [Mesorhizobium ventifaucium]
MTFGYRQARPARREFRKGAVRGRAIRNNLRWHAWSKHRARNRGLGLNPTPNSNCRSSPSLDGAWGRKYRGEGRLARYIDAETGEEIEPVAVDAVTGAKIGTRPIRVATPE